MEDVRQSGNVTLWEGRLSCVAPCAAGSGDVVSWLGDTQARRRDVLCLFVTKRAFQFLIV